MKKSILLPICMSLFLIPATSFAGTTAPQKGQLSELKINCVTDIPSTSFVAWTDAGYVHLNIVNSFGVKYMPIYAGLPTSEDLPTLQHYSDVLKDLGDLSQFKFKLKDCMIYNDGTFRCENGDSFKGKQHTFTLGSLASVLSSHTINDTHYDRVRVMADFTVEDKTYTVTMEYSPSECEVKYQKKNESK